MKQSCRISCPGCSSAAEVFSTGVVHCPACGERFEVGVYSPIPERERTKVTMPGGLVMFDGRLCVGRQTFSMIEISGASLSPRNSGFRLFSACCALLCAIAAALEGRWPIMLLAALVLFWLLYSIRTLSRQFVVSWITRGGREGYHCFGSREDAERLVAFISEPRPDHGARERQPELKS